ncbi:hypothetical protein PybrP1_002069, partial [[Pythium] brassicae (nom. inval.)]
QCVLFARYGECLLLDFIFNINNLAFYLGSFVVTSPAGRGIPIVDFLCLNQRADTLTAGIAFIKSVNSVWKAVEVFVIDKDFNEWRVLEKTFPEAKVLLCQFHAMKYVRYMLSTGRTRVASAAQERIEHKFRNVLRAQNDAELVRRQVELGDAATDDFALGKVREEYDRAVVDGSSICVDSRAACDEEPAKFSLVDKRGIVATTRCEDWTCTCSRFFSLRFPCRHNIVPAPRHLQFPRLPAAAVHARWNMQLALSVEHVNNTVAYFRAIACSPAASLPSLQLSASRSPPRQREPAV